MPIQSIYSPDHYSGDDVEDTFEFTFRILAKADLVAYTRDEDDVIAILELDSDYEIDDADVDTDDGGSVVLTDPLPDGTELFLVRKTTRTQLVNIEEGSPFPAAVVTKVFDRLTMMIQDVDYRLRQALAFSNASTFNDKDAPEPTNGKPLAWLSTALVNTSGATVILDDLPTADPAVEGQLWNDSGTVKVSAG